MNTSFHTRRRQGFTLIEVLVSSALTVVVLMMLFSVLLASMNAWEGGTARLQTNADARVALDLIARDLQSMVVRQTTYKQQWISSKPVPVQFAPAGITSTWLTFFAPSIDRDSGQEGDIVAISYAAGYQDPFSAANVVPMYGLYKTMINTTNTFRDALGKSDILTGFWNLQPPENQTHPMNRRGFIIPNVVDFKVAWWVRMNNGNSLVRIPATKELQFRNQLRFIYVKPADEIEELPPYDPNNPMLNVVDGKIESADISLTLLTDEGMREARVGNTSDYERLKDIIRKHGRTHTQRVVIHY